MTASTTSPTPTVSELLTLRMTPLESRTSMKYSATSSPSSPSNANWPSGPAIVVRRILPVTASRRRTTTTSTEIPGGKVTTPLSVPLPGPAGGVTRRLGQGDHLRLGTDRAQDHDRRDDTRRETDSHVVLLVLKKAMPGSIPRPCYATTSMIRANRAGLPGLKLPDSARARDVFARHEGTISTRGLSTHG